MRTDNSSGNDKLANIEDTEIKLEPGKTENEEVGSSPHSPSPNRPTIHRTNAKAITKKTQSNVKKVINNTKS